MASLPLRSGAAIALPIIAAASLYAGLACGALSGAGPTGWEPFAMLMLPAVLIGILLVAFVLLPLWCMFAEKHPRPRVQVVLVAAALWLLGCAALVAAGRGFGAPDALAEVLSLLLPGWALIGLFGVLASKRGLVAPPTRCGVQPAVSKQAGRATSPPVPGLGSAPSIGSATGAG